MNFGRFQFGFQQIPGKSPGDPNDIPSTDYYVDDVLFYGIYREIAGISNFYSYPVWTKACSHWGNINETQKMIKLEERYKERIAEKHKNDFLTGKRLSHSELMHQKNAQRMQQKMMGIIRGGKRVVNRPRIKNPYNALNKYPKIH